MRIATWNVNSIKQRLEAALDWLKEQRPDILCLQETKCPDQAFPREEFEALGYNVAIHGQKAFNGVAILSRLPFDEITRGIPGVEDEQARYLEAVISMPFGVVRVASIYLPNGNPPQTEKYSYKLQWMEQLLERAEALRELEEPLVLAGDYNVIPGDEDVYDPPAWTRDALCLPATRERFRALLNLGFVDALRATTDTAGLYSFWDYQAGAWQRNKGLRIDHLLLSPQAADRLLSVGIDKTVRGREKPSDHVPVYIDLRS